MRARAEPFAGPFPPQPPPLRAAPLERIGSAQGRHDPAQPCLVARGTTEDQAPLQHADGVRQVSLGEIQLTKTGVGNNRCLPSAVQRGEAERLLAVAPALGEYAKRT